MNLAATRTMALTELLAGLTDAPIPALDVTGVETDSRRVRPGMLFMAHPGISGHGLEHATEAVARGAVALVWDAGTPPDLAVPSLRLPALASQVGRIADRFYGAPSRDLSVVAITGTDGKTSCAHILAQAAEMLGQRCGYLGTLGYGFLPTLEIATHTTPDPVRLHAWLERMRGAGADSVAMEVSSHALAQHRVDGVAIEVAILTNIGHDHLDYHGSQAAYAQAKRRLFDFATLKAAVINADDSYGWRWLDDLPAHVAPVAYGLAADALVGREHYVAAAEVLTQPHGLVLDVASSWGSLRIESALVGRFNAYNLLAALASLLIRDVDPQAAVQALAGVRTVPGRMELVASPPHRPLVVVDYAHTPGALEQALHAISAHAAGRVLCVFGCGGERDTAKRPLMAAAAARYADAIWVTDDNPRGENPQAIIDDIMSGMPDAGPVTVERDRATAIAAAIDAAGEGDAVLIAGKGHEAYQIIGNERRVFDDREAARRVLEAA